MRWRTSEDALMMGFVAILHGVVIACGLVWLWVDVNEKHEIWAINTAFFTDEEMRFRYPSTYMHMQRLKWSRTEFEE